MKIQTSALVLALLLSNTEAIKQTSFKEYGATKEELETYNKLKADDIRASLQEAKELNQHSDDLLGKAIREGDKLTREENDKLKGLDLSSPQAEIKNQKLSIVTDKPLVIEPKKDAEGESEPKGDCQEKEEDCNCGMSHKFDKLAEQFKKVSDVVENASILGKYEEKDYECLKQEYKDAVKFIQKEEKNLKTKEELSTLDVKDKADFLYASSHHEVIGLSTHISKLLDEVYDFQGVITRFKAEKEPEEEVVTLMDDIKKEIVTLCKYDQERCDGWKKRDEQKAKEEKEQKEKDEKLAKLKGLDKDPTLKIGPGGPIPKGSDEVEAEKKAETDKAALDKAKAKESDDKNPASKEEACSKCDKLKKEKEDKETKMRPQGYDDKYKKEQKDHWDDKDHNQNEKVPNPTVNRFEKEALEKGAKHPEEHNGKNTDGDPKNSKEGEKHQENIQKDSKDKKPTVLADAKQAVKGDTKVLPKVEAKK